MKTVRVKCRCRFLSLQAYETPAKGLCILHAQIEADPSDEANTDARVDLPPFLDVGRRLNTTKDEQEYGAYGLSLIDKAATKFGVSNNR